MGTVIEFPVRLLGGIVNNVKLTPRLAEDKNLTFHPEPAERGAFPPFFDVPIRTVYVEYVLHAKIVPSSSRRGEAPIGLSR